VVTATANTTNESTLNTTEVKDLSLSGSAVAAIVFVFILILITTLIGSTILVVVVKKRTKRKYVHDKDIENPNYYPNCKFNILVC